MKGGCFSAFSFLFPIWQKIEFKFSMYTYKILLLCLTSNLNIDLHFSVSPHTQKIQSDMLTEYSLYDIIHMNGV